MSEIRLTVAVPTAGTVCAGFARSFGGLMAYLAGGIRTRPKEAQQIQTDWCESASWIANRHELVKRAIDAGRTHLVFLDDDMTFAPNILDVLFSRHQPVVATNYLIKNAACDSFVAVGLDGQRVPTLAHSTGIEPILYSGFGVSLFDVEVFRKTQRPWFTPQFNPATDEYTTEDNPCYAKIREAGFPVYLDHDATKLIESHVGRRGWRWADYAPRAPVPNPVACATNGKVLPRLEAVRG